MARSGLIRSCSEARLALGATSQRAYSAGWISRISNRILPLGTSISTFSPHFVSDQALRQRARDLDLAGVVVFFSRAHKREFFFVSEIEILTTTVVPNTTSSLGSVAMSTIRERLSLSRSKLILACIIACDSRAAVIFGVLAQIPFAAGGGYALRKLRHFDVFHVRKLTFELVVPGARHGDDVGHIKELPT